MLNRVSPFFTVCVSGRQSLPFLALDVLAEDLLAVFDLFAVLCAEPGLLTGVRSMTGAGAVLQAISVHDINVTKQYRNTAIFNWYHQVRGRILPALAWSGGIRIGKRALPDREFVRQCLRELPAAHQSQVDQAGLAGYGWQQR